MKQIYMFKIRMKLQMISFTEESFQLWNKSRIQMHKFWKWEFILNYPSTSQMQHQQKILQNKPWINFSIRTFMGIEIVMNNKLISNHKFKITIVMMKDINAGDQERFWWKEIAGSSVKAVIHDAYKKVTQWKERHIFTLLLLGKIYLLNYTSL